MNIVTKACLGATAALVALTGTTLPAASAASAATDTSAEAAARCSIKAWGYQGYYKCGTRVKEGYVDWNEDGRTDEVFVIAPNRTIWHTWKNAGGWKEMPGNGRADDMMGAAETGTSRRCIIVYVDKGYHYWQNCFYNGKWHNWTTSG